MDANWKERVRARAFSLWEREKDPSVSAEEHWQRACEIETDAPTVLEAALREFLRPPDSSKFKWLKRAFFAGHTDWIRTLEEVDRRRIVFSQHKINYATLKTPNMKLQQ